MFPALALVSALLADPGPAAPPTYARDIAPIFQRSCQDCHRPGEIAPMPLLTYEDARPWIASIKATVQSGEMPPWHADPSHGKFRNDPRLSSDEVRTIADWVEAGAPAGDPKDLPAPRKFSSGWRLGEPDAVFSMPETFRVPASGEIPYKYYVVPTGFTEDKWVRAVDVRPGNREIVHHIIVFVREPGKEGRRGGIWRNHLGGVAPGEQADVFPPGTGKLIKAGSQLVFQMHYTPSGEATTDRSSVGLHFSSEPLRQVHTRAAMNPYFRIPPGASDHEVRSRYTFRDDAVLLSLMPHMHLRGKTFRYELVGTDGRRSTLLHVPRWDFDWQHGYVLDEPLRVPAGSRIECVATFDNSARNEANPDPESIVTWGDQTWDEMMIGFLWYIDDDGLPVPSPSSTEGTGVTGDITPAPPAPTSTDG